MLTKQVMSEKLIFDNLRCAIFGHICINHSNFHVKSQISPFQGFFHHLLCRKWDHQTFYDLFQASIHPQMLAKAHFERSAQA